MRAHALELVDRRARIARHDPMVRGFDPRSPLSVGNGGFAFTADATGLQTLPERYRAIPRATEAEWGWHSFPNPAGRLGRRPFSRTPGFPRNWTVRAEGFRPMV